MVVAKIIICDLVYKKDYTLIDRIEVSSARKIVNILNKGILNNSYKVRIRFIRPELK